MSEKLKNGGDKCPFNGLKMADFDMSKFIRPDQPTRCTWKLGTDEATVHTQRPFGPRPRVLDDILHVIGHTPLVKLNNIPKAEGIVCQMYAKCEFLNPGGSVKDRIGYRMVIDAEEKNLLTPGCTIIEPTSGNTGIGLAMACAVKGYRCVIVMPEKMSDEKVGTLRSLGAEIIRTPTEAAFDSPESLISVAQRLQQATPNSHILDQYRNSGNPLAHYDGTGAEILWQCDNKVDVVVVGAGTGGTISGIGRKIKEQLPSCTVYGVDPLGSILARPELMNETSVNYYEVEGIGYDFIPTVLDHSVVDGWVKIGDHDSFTMAKRLQREEGLLCGGSSGAAMHAAVEYARNLREDQVCVVLLPDSIRNYMSKFVNDSWLESRFLKDPVNIKNYSWWDLKVDELRLPVPETIAINETCGAVIQKLKEKNLDQMPLVDLLGEIKGAVTRSHLLNRMLSEKLSPNDEISKAIFKQIRKVDEQTTLGRISRALEREPFIIVTRKETRDFNAECTKTLEVPIAVVTKEKFLDYIFENANEITNGNGHAS